MMNGVTAMFGQNDKSTPEEHGKALAAVLGITLLLYLALPDGAIDSEGWSVMPSVEPLRVDMVIY